MRRIGITGPTGAGKTTALRVLAGMGAVIIDADAAYHELLETSTPLRSALESRFGASILDKRGMIDRKRLGSMVFGDPAALAALNEITHRFVLAEIDRRTEEAARAGSPAAAVDAVALIESGAAEGCCAVVGVLAPKDLRIRRIMAREGISEDYARRRAEAQPEDAFYRANCTHILENGAEVTPAAFEERARRLFQAILEDP